MTARELSIPELCLVVLVGVSGSGKSTFAGRHFGPFEVISSDYCRGLVSDDEQNQEATADAFEVLNFIAGKRLAAGRLTVIDATNVQPAARRSLIELARAHDVLPVAIVLDEPESVLLARTADRGDRSLTAAVIHRQYDQLRRSSRSLAKEGFRVVHELRGADQVAQVILRRTRLLNNFRDEHGPFDVIGDVHGCHAELLELLTKLDYRIDRDPAGRAIDATHPDGRRAVFVGDLVDRGPDTPGVLRLVMGMVDAGHALAVPGNHEHKLIQALRGRKVTVSHGLAETLAQLAAEPPEFRAQVEQFCYDLVSHLVLDDGKLVIAHAGLKEAYHGRASGRVRSFALYGDTTGETDEFGLPVRYPWADDYRGRAMVLYGHTPTPAPSWVNNTLCLDTGCVFGGALTALRYPEKEVISVAAHRVWYESTKPFPTAAQTAAATAAGSGAVGGAGNAGATRDPELLDLSDVLGKRVVETEHHGRVGISADSAAGALEVMSRFALPPRWLRYLPPTMSPAAAGQHSEYFEHPAEAFATYANIGVTDLICEEKHMGSRAVVLVCRDQAAATAHFGAPDGETGAVHTRTGRPFFAADLSEELLATVRTAVATAGLWEELSTDWLLLDAELMPWSVKAAELIKQQYAQIGAAARAVFPAALDVLDRAAGRGVELTELRERTARRADNAAAFSAVYRRYRWPTDGLQGVRLAPFQVLAGAAGTYENFDHGWHLGIADRLAEAAPELIQRTRSRRLDASDPAAVAAAESWWRELTAGGGEGMVVKPFGNLTRARRGLAQPGLKVRGREYLRLTYGPDYLEPANLARLRERNLGPKRALALREYALGLEALNRTVKAEPLWRVHEPVFAVLALESEPVDPRL